MKEIEYGYCKCGCGGKTPIAKRTKRERGHVAGEPLPFIRFHKSTGSNHWRWKGGGKYRRVNSKEGFKWEHRLIAEKALGKELPDKAVVHHWMEGFGMRLDSCLVVCEDQAYHMLLHLRQRAFESCGYAGWLKCQVCKKWDDPKNMYVRPNHPQAWHHACKREYDNRRKQWPPKNQPM